jgi:hypothetical protein
MTSLGRIIRSLFLAAFASLVLVGPVHALDVGQKAPDFTLTAPGNKAIRLADLLGKGPVVIYTFVDAFGAA